MRSTITNIVLKICLFCLHSYPERKHLRTSSFVCFLNSYMLSLFLESLAANKTLTVLEMLMIHGIKRKMTETAKNVSFRTEIYFFYSANQKQTARSLKRALVSAKDTPTLRSVIPLKHTQFDSDLSHLAQPVFCSSSAKTHLALVVFIMMYPI